MSFGCIRSAALDWWHYLLLAGVCCYLNTSLGSTIHGFVVPQYRRVSVWKWTQTWTVVPKRRTDVLVGSKKVEHHRHCGRGIFLRMFITLNLTVYILPSV
ncbi:hypothetical protein GGS20DRAFT_102562 [Poronia punctata]|nr:hypothetical protein GGS20DRAFT_102562 [Poronia punctata]